MIFNFKNRKIFWDIPKWNRGQTKWDGGSNSYSLIGVLIFKINISPNKQTFPMHITIMKIS